MSKQGLNIKPAIRCTRRGSDDSCWRKHGEAKRERLLREDQANGGSTFVINRQANIRHYFEIADRVLDQFREAYQKIPETNLLDETYLMGSRLIKFLADVLPTHDQYNEKDGHFANLRGKSQNDLAQVRLNVDDVALMIDEEAFQMASSDQLDDDPTMRSNTGTTSKDKDSSFTRKRVRFALTMPDVDEDGFGAPSLCSSEEVVSSVKSIRVVDSEISSTQSDNLSSPLSLAQYTTEIPPPLSEDLIISSFDDDEDGWEHFESKRWGSFTADGNWPIPSPIALSSHKRLVFVGENNETEEVGGNIPRMTGVQVPERPGNTLTETSDDEHSHHSIQDCSHQSVEEGNLSYVEKIARENFAHDINELHKDESDSDAHDSWAQGNSDEADDSTDGKADLDRAIDLDDACDAEIVAINTRSFQTMDKVKGPTAHLLISSPPAKTTVSQRSHDSFICTHEETWRGDNDLPFEEPVTMSSNDETDDEDDHELFVRMTRMEFAEFDNCDSSGGSGDKTTLTAETESMSVGNGSDYSNDNEDSIGRDENNSLCDSNFGSSRRDDYVSTLTNCDGARKNVDENQINDTRLIESSMPVSSTISNKGDRQSPTSRRARIDYLEAKVRQYQEKEVQMTPSVADASTESSKLIPSNVNKAVVHVVDCKEKSKWSTSSTTPGLQVKSELCHLFHASSKISIVRVRRKAPLLSIDTSTEVKPSSSISLYQEKETNCQGVKFSNVPRALSPNYSPESKVEKLRRIKSSAAWRRRQSTQHRQGHAEQHPVPA